MTEGRLFFTSEIFEGGRRRRQIARPQKTWIEPSRTLPVFAECDVLVVGGGPAGTAAATSAARLGADVILLERYNHLGGLSTGGLVFWIDRMTDWDGKPVIRGVAEEIFDRLPKEYVCGPARQDWGSRDAATAAYWSLRSAAFHGIVTWSPMVCPERLKLAALDMVEEAGARLVLHGWASVPIVEDGAVRGVVFESKEGRQAILAKATVDATGDGDIFHRAGVPSETDIEKNDIHHCMNTAWIWAGVDMKRWMDFRTSDPKGYSDFMATGREKVRHFERPFTSWRDDVALFMGPRQSGFDALNVDDLTEVEAYCRRLMWQHLEVFRAHAPGFAGAYPVQSAPQMGVRHTRRLVGVEKVVRTQWDDGTPYATEVGVSPSLSPKFRNVSVPYGALLPQVVDGLLAPGRHLSCDATSHSFMREIPQCWLTGHAAGAAAAIAAHRGVAPRAVDIGELQAALQKQGAYLRPSAAGTVKRAGASG
ncbi:FAD-dependent oxidoreductase [Reyranella sp. CPCC 100927]|uniref:FAD-dependent oxidoreductase n=1 Tax=Reyranella sp. CPCC 100927 TaxID=2599616 RepID=UPI0011B548F3|nr:FAD-dependent oxidoreductase [Reyranella sp. CPCC 100927]TWT01724.1 FAD-dependent oxidoreductase [Reyranella sp. CPCC 100927]